MGVRSDLAIAFSKEGWDKLQKHITDNLCSGGQDTIYVLLSDADKKLVHSNGDRLIFWECIKTYTDDVLSLVSAMDASLAREDFYSVELVEDGSEENNGCYWDNPFGIGTTHSIFMDESGCDTASDIVDDMYVKAVHTAAPIVPINDCVCHSCGNDRCSKNEKSCWKCGASL